MGSPQILAATEVTLRTNSDESVRKFILLFKNDAAMFDKVTELLKFLVQSVVPLVTLAVGYYLGDRGRAGHQKE